MKLHCIISGKKKEKHALVNTGRDHEQVQILSQLWIAEKQHQNL